MQPGHAPLRLDQRAHGPIWGRLTLSTGYGELLHQPYPPSGPHRDFRFFLRGDWRARGDDPTTTTASPPPSADDLWIADKYHTRVVPGGGLESDPMTSTMDGVAAIPEREIVAACVAALVNASRPPPSPSPSPGDSASRLRGPGEPGRPRSRPR